MIPLHDDNPTEIIPFLTVSFIVICVLVFFWQLSLGPAGNQQAVYSLGVIPAVLLNKLSLPPALAVIPPELTIVTSMFMHGGFMHLAGNMLYLWIFGNNIEDALGHFRFIIFYFLCGVAAVFGQVLQNPDSQIPMIGASGAISGVLGGYLLLYPHARVLVLIPLGFYSQLVRLPAVWVLGLWFLLQIVSSMMADPDAAGVAWFAHIGGF
ncbi:MAG: rhomboid family intramembrane serine protease, partial [Gammaproteobacteria bacterium]|nr:rhomboid family intramembrane serine protease [Gammaproteobacteria bacterium]